MKNRKMEYIIVFLAFIVICLTPFIPKTSSKYVEKKTKKITINAVQPTYTIVFDANGGIGEMENQVFTYSVAEDLHNNTFTNEAASFASWNTKADGSGDSYSDGESIYNLTSINGEIITFYAQWVDKIARIGNTYYDTLAEAIADVNSSGEQTEIILLRSTNESITIPSGKNVILNLSGNTIGNVGNDNTIKNRGVLILKNGNVINNAQTNGAINNYNTGTITIDGVNVTVYGTGNRQAFYNERGIATIKGGSYLTSISNARPAVTNVSGGTMTITDATIVSTVSSGLKNDGTLIIGSDNGSVNKNNPKIKGKTIGLETSKNVVFYDGVLMGKIKAADNPNRLTSIPNGYTIIDDEEEINGEMYYEKYIDIGIVITFDPNGGIITSGDTTKTIGIGKPVGTLPTASNLAKVFDGWYTDTEEGEEIHSDTIVEENSTFYAHWINNSCVARIGDVMYDTLQEAIDAASDNESTSIELLKSTTENLTISSTKNIDLNLGENTITNYGNAAVITNSGSLSLTGGLLTSNADTATINNLSGRLNINSMEIQATGSRQAIYINSGEVNIQGDSYLTSKTSGTPSTTSMQRGTIQCLSDGTLNITGGTIVGENQHAVTNEGILTIGVKDGIIGTTTPTLIGKIDGVKSTGTVNFYDGIIKGKTNAIDGEISDIESDASVVNTTDGDYKVAYLEQNDNQDSNNSMITSEEINMMANELTNSIAEEENKEEIIKDETEQLMDNQQLDKTIQNGDKNELINIEEDNKIEEELNDDKIIESNDFNEVIEKEYINTNNNSDVINDDLEQKNEEKVSDAEVDLVEDALNEKTDDNNNNEKLEITNIEPIISNDDVINEENN